mgnify:CR=1 FL=1
MPSGTRVEARDDAAVELRRARIDGDGVALRRIADRLGAGVEHQPQDRARVVRRAADDEVRRRRSPQISSSHSRFDSKPPAASTTAARANVGVAVGHPHGRRLEAAVANVEADDVGVVARRDAEALGRRVVRCSSAPCRRRGRTRWCARGAACRAATAESGRRSGSCGAARRPTHESSCARASRW